MPCSSQGKNPFLLVDSARSTAGEWREGWLLGTASTTLGGDRDSVPHRCELWALLYNSAELGVILPALSTQGRGDETGATLASLNHFRLVLPSPTPHQVNGAVGSCQVQVHQSIRLGQETVEGLGIRTEGLPGKR